MQLEDQKHQVGIKWAYDVLGEMKRLWEYAAGCVALKTVKSMVHGYGWQRTPVIMQALH